MSMVYALGLRVPVGGLIGLIIGWGAWWAARVLSAYYARPDGGAAVLPWLKRAPGWLYVACSLVFGCLGACAAWRTPEWPRWLMLLGVSATLLVVSLVDLATRRVPNALCLAVVGWAVLQILWQGQPSWLAAAGGVVLAGGLFALLAVISRGQMGSGDVKLAATLGGLLGYPLILRGLFWGVLLGGLAALVLLLTRHVERRGYIAYAPYLAAGCWAIWVLSLAFGA